MLEPLLKLLAPDYCLNCSKVGVILCVHCEYNIVSEPYQGCLECGLLTSDGVCRKHRSAFSKAWVVAERSDLIERLLNQMKYQPSRSAAQVAGRLLGSVLAELPKDTLIVPVPTIARHLRQRGFDHTLVIAKTVAKQKDLQISKVLKRKNQTQQVGLKRRERLINAQDAFTVDKPDRVVGKNCLLIDDIYTTGATIGQAAKQLRAAGAQEVWVGAVARQELA